MHKLTVALAGLAAATAIPAAAATTVFSDDFENGLGGFVKAGTVDAVQGSAYAAIGFQGDAAARANSFAAFAGGNGTGGNFTFGNLLSTSIATVLNELYTVSFDYGAIGNVGDTSQSLSFTTSLPGTSVTFQPLVASNNLNTALGNRYVGTFTGTGSIVSLSFTGVGGAGDNADVLLDNVLVRAGAIPEPATWAMMVIGFGSLGAVMRRRRRDAARGVLAAV